MEIAFGVGDKNRAKLKDFNCLVQIILSVTVLSTMMGQKIS